MNPSPTGGAAALVRAASCGWPVGRQSDAPSPDSHAEIVVAYYHRGLRYELPCLSLADARAAVRAIEEGDDLGCEPVITLGPDRPHDPLKDRRDPRIETLETTLRAIQRTAANAPDPSPALRHIAELAESALKDPQ